MTVLGRPLLARLRGHAARRLAARVEAGLSTRVYLVALVIALLGPGLVFTGVLLDRYGRTERARAVQDARESVRQVATAVDRDVVALQAILETLATSPHLRGDDLASFDAQAREVRGLAGLDIVLRRVSDGQQLVNTRLPRGGALPRIEEGHDLALLETHRPVVSGVFIGPSGRDPVYVVSAPVPREGPVERILSFVVPTTRLRDIMRQEITPGWVAGIVDAESHVVARTEDHEGATGQPISTHFDPRAAGPDGTWTGVDRSGREVLFAAAPARRTGWTVAASLPRTLIDARLRTWMAIFVGFGLAALALSSLVAVRLWALVERPIRHLSRAGEALARGERLPAVSTPVREVRQLAEALGAAGAALRARMAERDRAIADQARGLAALRESEARFRHMADSVPALIWMTDAEGGLTFVNLHFDHVFGIPGVRLLREGWRDVVVPEDLDAFAVTFFTAFEAREPFRAEVRVRGREDSVRWLRCEGVARLDDDGGFLGYTGCSLDVTDVREARDRQQLLINELNHRVKNTLATVQSLAMQSLRGLRSREAETARGAFEARLLALARAHDALTRSHWEGAPLAAIVADAVAPVEPPGGRRRRFAIQGPDLWLPAQSALSIAMALHELLTNAVKYGALSVPAGRVAIRWGVLRDAPADGDEVPAPRLRLAWREEGGPPVAPPERRGFGSRLMERGLARELGGVVELRFAPEGVTCTIEAPLPPASVGTDEAGRAAAE